MGTYGRWVHTEDNFLGGARSSGGWVLCPAGLSQWVGGPPRGRVVDGWGGAFGCMRGWVCQWVGGWVSGWVDGWVSSSRSSSVGEHGWMACTQRRRRLPPVLPGYRSAMYSTAGCAHSRRLHLMQRAAAGNHSYLLSFCMVNRLTRPKLTSLRAGRGLLP